MVIKYGGAAMAEPLAQEDFARDVVLLKYVGMNPVVVHGGGPEITAYMERLDLPVQFVEGLRVSDPQTVEVAKMVLVGKVNKDIVLLINRHGQPAVGICGDDGLLFRAARQTSSSGQDIGFVGRIERVDVNLLNHIAQDYIPVVASVGADREGNSYNINADEAAGAVARALTGPQAPVPDRRARLAGHPGRSRAPSSRRPRRRRSRRPWPNPETVASAEGCGPSCGPASRPSTEGWGRLTSSMAGCRTRSCSNCSPTRAPAR